jgi:hypothetical protein
MDHNEYGFGRYYAFDIQEIYFVLKFRDDENSNKLLSQQQIHNICSLCQNYNMGESLYDCYIECLEEWNIFLGIYFSFGLEGVSMSNLSFSNRLLLQ